MTADQETIIMNTPKSTDNQNDDSTNFNSKFNFFFLKI